jgi:hypothetical protein
VDLHGTEKTPMHDGRGAWWVLSQVTRRSYSGQTGGEILLVRGY